jgi:hypothetical protein
MNIIIRGRSAYQNNKYHRLVDDNTACGEIPGKYFRVSDVPVNLPIRQLCGNCFQVRNYTVLASPDKREIS